MDKQTKMTNPPKTLEQFGRSPWLDFIEWRYLDEGNVGEMIELNGMTSNPSMFEKALGHGDHYNAGFKELVAKGGVDAQTIYETPAIADIRKAADLLRLVYDRTGSVDGYVSLEVSPHLALATDDTVAEARRLWKMVDRPNLMVKMPGTDQGTPAIKTLISEGLNINVTLLFSQQTYKGVAKTYISGLENLKSTGSDVGKVASVASFFVSRINTQIDKQIDERGKVDGDDTETLKRLRGKVAIANAKLAYEHYLELVGSERCKALAAAGAKPQRLLWASTGVKDKAYPDTLYVEQLIGRDTVNTMPPATMDAYRDHSQSKETLTEGVEDAYEFLGTAKRLGLDLDKVTHDLVEDGVKLFAKAADDLLGAVAAKRDAMLGDTRCRR